VANDVFLPHRGGYKVKRTAVGFFVLHGVLVSALSLVILALSIRLMSRISALQAPSLARFTQAYSQEGMPLQVIPVQTIDFFCSGAFFSCCVGPFKYRAAVDKGCVIYAIA